MANALTLLQTSPASNPDRNIVDVTPSGAYVNGTPDPLPLGAIADPGSLVQVPFSAQNLPVTPSIWNNYTAGYQPVLERTITNGVTSFGLRWYSLAGVELASGAYPAAITGGETILEILCPTTQQ